MLAYLHHFIEVSGAARRVSSALKARQRPLPADIETLGIPMDAFPAKTRHTNDNDKRLYRSLITAG